MRVKKKGFVLDPKRKRKEIGGDRSGAVGIATFHFFRIAMRA
jgi:hypothetical protein